MRVNPPGRFKAPSDNNQFLLEKVTWTRMGRHGKTSDTEQWWMLAEGHLTHRLFGDMLRRIWALPVPGG